MGAGGKIHNVVFTLTRAEEEEVSLPLGSQLLSAFQKDKFVHFFYHVLDVNRWTAGQRRHDLIVHRDHVISQEDFDDLNDRVRHYMDWSTNNMNYQTLKEVIQIPKVHKTSSATQVHTLYIQYFLGQALKFAPKDEGFDFCEFKGFTSYLV